MEFNAWKDKKGESPVELFIENLDRKPEALLYDKIDHYEKLKVLDLLQEKTLEKIKTSSAEKVKMYELKFKQSPPIRMIGTLEKNEYIAYHAFFKKHDGPIKPKEIKTALKRIL